MSDRRRFHIACIACTTLAAAIALGLGLGAGSALAAGAAMEPAPPDGAKAYNVTVSIKADRRSVWALLTDARGFADWNPAVKKIEGEIGPGKHLKVFPNVPGDPSFDLDVVSYTADEQMVWAGGMPLGLFKAQRAFTVLDMPDGTVRFTMRELFGGPMAGLILGSVPDLTPHFDQFAEALKKRAEADYKAPPQAD